MDVRIEERWRQTYPGAAIGILAMDGLDKIASVRDLARAEGLEPPTTAFGER